MPEQKGAIIQIKVKGEFTVSEARQALFEKLQELEDDYAVRHVRNLSLYLTPTNGFGDEVVPHNHAGQKVDTLYSQGPYRSAAEVFKL